MVKQMLDIFSLRTSSSPMGGRLMAAGLISGALIVKALIAFLLLPVITHHLGDNYHSDLFPDDYDLIAENLLSGRGYRIYADTSETMLRSPGFVLVLAAIFSLFGKSLLAVQIVQYLMSIATAIVTYLISQRLYLTKSVSLMASVLFLFNPVSMMSDTRAGNDSTLTLSLTLVIWLLLKAIDSQRQRDFVLTGFVLGYAMLVKASVALIFPCVFLFLVIMAQFQFRTLLRNFVIVGFVAAGIMTPWVVRNYEISGQFVPTMTVAGLAIFQGEEAERNISSGEDSWQLLDDASKEQIRIGHEMGLRMREDFFPQFYDPQDEVAFYRELARRGWAEYRKDPILLARTVVHNLWAFWFEGRTGKATIINIAILAPLILVSISGALLSIRRERNTWILIISVIAFILPHLVIIAVARYCTAILPLMCILSAGNLFSPIAQRISSRFRLRRL
jgi:4-amino-4-deoxy-L-arabinose transferase-like glycosyltransferase